MEGNTIPEPLALKRERGTERSNY